MDRDCDKFLRLLGLHSEPPTLDFLKKIVRAHLKTVPYENLSKLLGFEAHGPTIPSFTQYLEQLESVGSGGTCFAQNIHLNHLLLALGFRSRRVGVVREGKLSHVSLRVRFDGGEYFVDVGLMSSFAGPFSLAPEAGFETWIGDQRFVFAPLADRENYTLEIYRDGRVIRSFLSTSAQVSEEALSEAIRSTYEQEALFMQVLCVHRVFEDRNIGLWNHVLYEVRGRDTVKRELRDLAAFEKVFREELLLPHLPVAQALETLKSKSGVSLLP
jgi:N-hydroxyarylamine O-acetyltransferase